jgi:hypothetical protein
VRSENLKVAPTFQGHHHRAGLSCLVIHRFQGIPSLFPKSISTILDILISQGLMPSLLKQITDQFFAYWELDNYVLIVGKSESFSRLGFRQSDCPTVLPSGSKSSNSSKFPSLMQDTSKGLEWLKFALDLIIRNSPHSNRQSTEMDNLILSQPTIEQTIPSSQGSDSPSSSQDSSSSFTPSLDMTDSDDGIAGSTSKTLFDMEEIDDNPPISPSSDHGTNPPLGQLSPCSHSFSAPNDLESTSSHIVGSSPQQSDSSLSTPPIDTVSDLDIAAQLTKATGNPPSSTLRRLEPITP